jgi:hypothetical protein
MAGDGSLDGTLLPRWNGARQLGEIRAHQVEFEQVLSGLFVLLDQEFAHEPAIREHRIRDTNPRSALSLLELGAYGAHR